MRKFGDQSGIPEKPQGSPQRPSDPQNSAEDDGKEDNFPFLEVGEYGEGGREAFIASMGGVPAQKAENPDGREEASDGVTGSFSDEPAEENAGSGTAEGASAKNGGSQDDLDTLGLYLEELKSVDPLTKSEEDLLVERASTGSTAARDRLIEGSLMDALRVIQDFMGGPLGVDEMIGISNLALVDAVQEYVRAGAVHSDAGNNAAGSGRKDSSGSLRTHVKEVVRERLKEAVEEERRAKKGADSVADQANRLTETSRILANELGRQPKVEELAERMKITPDEVRELLKMTMQAMDSGSGLE